MSDYEFKVIEIIDEFSILINYGRDDGAYEGDEIRVLSIGDEVVDPETKESLGTLDFVKDTLTIAIAYDSFSLCQKIETSHINVLTSPLSQFSKTTKEVKALNVDEKDFSHKSFSKEKTIKVGDTIEIL